MIARLRNQITALNPTQQALVLAALMLSLVLALVALWACRKYNSRRSKWLGAP